MISPTSISRFNKICRYIQPNIIQYIAPGDVVFSFRTILQRNDAKLFPSKKKNPLRTIHSVDAEVKSSKRILGLYLRIKSGLCKKI